MVINDNKVNSEILVGLEKISHPYTIHDRGTMHVFYFSLRLTLLQKTRYTSDVKYI